MLSAAKHLDTCSDWRHMEASLIQMFRCAQHDTGPWFGEKNNKGNLL